MASQFAVELTDLTEELAVGLHDDKHEVIEEVEQRHCQNLSQHGSISSPEENLKIIDFADM